MLVDNISISGGKKNYFLMTRILFKTLRVDFSENIQKKKQHLSQSLLFIVIFYKFLIKLKLY